VRHYDTDDAGRPYAEDVLDREELADYYAAHNWPPASRTPDETHRRDR
jgi:hypothetical protein